MCEPEKPIAKPVQYELVRTFYTDALKPNEKPTQLPISVREKVEPHPYWSGFMGRSTRYYHEQTQEVSLAWILTSILQSLEKLGVEVIMEPAKSATVELKVKQPEPPKSPAPDAGAVQS